VIRRSRLVRGSGDACFPGGSIERGESECEAVRREMLEELALDVQPRRLLWRSVTAWGVELAWWLTEIESDAEPVANPLEVESFHWLTAEQIRGLTQLLASNVEFLDAWEGGRIER
jgi:8-oxo-dGTP diphosphatase